MMDLVVKEFENEFGGGKKHELPENVDRNQVESAIKALIKYAAKSKGKSLFMDAPVRILMDIKAFKTPGGKHHFFNIRLPHTPHKDLLDLDVLLVVPDQKDRDPDHVVGEVKDAILNSEDPDKIKIREVMTLKQFRDDYSTFESKRALAKSIDVVVAEKKVWKLIPAILGREFMKKKKFPMMIPGKSFAKQDLAKQIHFALHKTVLNLSLKGLKSTIVVGHDTSAEDELTDNASCIISWLSQHFPGGWENIQSVHLHIGENNMPPLPVYISTGTRNDVQKRPMTRGGFRNQPMEDEISTQLGKRMKVYPTGKIEVVKSEETDPLDDIL